MFQGKLRGTTSSPAPQPPEPVRPSASIAPPPSNGPTASEPSSAPLAEALRHSLPQPARSLALLGLLLIAVGGVLYLARVVFIPLAFAFMLSFLLGPLVTGLERLRMPRALGAALIVMALLGGVGFGALELAEPAADWVGRSPAVLKALERKVRPWRRPVKDVSQFAEQVERMAKVDDKNGPQEVMLQPPSMLSTALDTIWALGAGALVVLFALYFMLLSGEMLMGRVIAWVPDLRSQRHTTDVLDSIQRGMSRYLGTVFCINLAVGIAVGTGMFFLHMPNPVLWGALAAVVNFVPYVGPLAGILTVGAVALVTFDKPGAALAPPLFYLALASIEGNLITPLILGRTTELDPLVIFIWLLFWGWLWGVPGVIVAVPLLMLIKLTCEKSRVLAPVAALLSRNSIAPS
ncbi:MAG: AI-2E family transporter [Deltaproteobacteria bacterium]